MNSFPHLFISIFFFFFNDTATTEIYTLSLHDALPISRGRFQPLLAKYNQVAAVAPGTIRLNCSERDLTLYTPNESWLAVRKDLNRAGRDRKSTRLNSSH